MVRDVRCCEDDAQCRRLRQPPRRSRPPGPCPWRHCCPPRQRGRKAVHRCPRCCTPFVVALLSWTNVHLPCCLLHPRVVRHCCRVIHRSGGANDDGLLLFVWLCHHRCRCRQAATTATKLPPSSCNAAIASAKLPRWRRHPAAAATTLPVAATYAAATALPPLNCRTTAKCYLSKVICASVVSVRASSNTIASLA
jgi:hypothetical protein